MLGWDIRYQCPTCTVKMSVPVHLDWSGMSVPVRLEMVGMSVPMHYRMDGNICVSAPQEGWEYLFPCIMKGVGMSAPMHHKRGGNVCTHERGGNICTSAPLGGWEYCSSGASWEGWEYLYQCIIERVGMSVPLPHEEGGM